MSVYTTTYGPVYGEVISMSDSLVLADAIELLGGGQPSTDPRCPGAVFRLGDPFDFGAPQPESDLVAQMILDGSRKAGRRRAGNRTMSLPVKIFAATRMALDAAREVLMSAIDAERWTMIYTRDDPGAVDLPLVFDCQQADATVVTWSVKQHKQRMSELVLSFQAAPYGRSDVPVVVDFPSPLAGYTAPAAPVVMDQFAQVPGNWLTPAQSGFEGGTTAGWSAVSGCTVANSVAQARTGTHSLALTATGTANMAVRAPAGVLGLPVVAGLTGTGQGVTVTTPFRAATVARPCAATCSWFDAAGNFLSTSVGATANDSTSAWTLRTSSFKAPAGAEYGVGGGQVNSPAGAGEVHYLDDAVIGYQWNQSLIGPGPNSAHWNPGAAPMTTPNGGGLPGQYVNNSIGPVNLTGQAALTLFAGFGSTAYFAHWAKAGGPVTFSFTLTDGTVTIGFATTIKNVKGSSNSATPAWVKVRAGIPQGTPLNLAAVTGWGVTVTNRSSYGDLIFTELYLDSLQAQPVPLVPGPAPQRGFLIDLAGIAGTARAAATWQFQQQGATVSVTKRFTTPGTFNWPVPPGVTQVDYFGIGAGGDMAPFAANGQGGGSGGSSGQGSAIPVTPGAVGTVVVGLRGQAQAMAGYPGTRAPGASSFTSDLGTVISCPGGNNAAGTTGAAAPAAGTAGFAGGAGGAGVATSSGGGGGGGGSAGASGTGGAGGAASGSNGGAAGAAGAGGGGIGGKGATWHVSNGIAPVTGYGGGIGGSPGGTLGGNRTPRGGFADGYGQLTYLQPPSAKTLIAHRPGPGQPDTLCPFVSPDFSDVPDGTTEYPVQSTIPGLPARFDGTYSVYAINYTWDTPAASRNLSVAVKQYEQASGNVMTYSTPVKTFTPSTDPDVSLNGIVSLGEITLPGKRLPAENQTSLFTATITDSDVSDRFMDILFLSTDGQTLIINGTAQYANFWAEEPLAADIGLIMGSVLDRGNAVSVTDQAMIISGGPLFVDPEGNQLLLVYAVEGAPGVQLTYFPRWRAGRFA